jgi:HEAT repeat protein
LFTALPVEECCSLINMNLSNLPSIDAYSFLIGLLCGFLAYFLFIEKKLISKIISISKEIVERLSASSNLEKAEYLIKKQLLQTAQNNHLLRHAFPLESVLIPPKLLLPPKYLYPEFYTTSSSLINLFFPYTPDWPELCAQFPVDAIPCTHLAKANGKTLIIGQPGSGKTVLLSALVISMVQDSDCDILPIFLSAKKLLAYLDDEKDPLQPLVAAFTDEVPLISSSQMLYILKSKIATQNALLIIDDVDHLQIQENEKLINYLNAFETQYHFQKIILAADSNSLGKALSQHYFPLSVASWSLNDQNDYLNLFQTAWQKCNFSSPNTTKSVVRSCILAKWIQDETLYYSPFEIATRTWLIYSGYPIGDTIVDCLSNLLKLFAVTKEDCDQAALFAYALLRLNQTSATIDTINEFWANQSDPVLIHVPGFVENQTQPLPRTKPRLQDTFIKSYEKNGIFLQDADGKISFKSPIWAGFLASKVSFTDLITWYTPMHLQWSLASQFLRFSTISDFPETWYESFFQKESSYPFDKTYLKLARFIPDMPIDHPVRNGILKWIAKSAFMKQLPAVEKSDLFAAMLVSRDPSVPKLLMDFQTMPDPEIRFLATLTIAGFAQIDQLNLFLDHLNDAEQNVRNAASLAFFAFRTKKTTEILIDILLQGDEYMKQTVAEALAVIAPLNKELLTEAIASEDLLIRRAAVFGLSRISDSWAMDLLSRSAIEDAQWIVRNAASQIIENKDIYKTHLIPQLPHPSNAPWLISFAGKMGKGIPKSGFVKDILLTALDQGNVDEKISAMNYLRIIPDADIIRAILTLLVNKNRTVQQASAYALWYIDKILGNIPLQKEKRIS